MLTDRLKTKREMCLEQFFNRKKIIKSRQIALKSHSTDTLSAVPTTVPNIQFQLIRIVAQIIIIYKNLFNLIRDRSSGVQQYEQLR